MNMFVFLVSYETVTVNSMYLPASVEESISNSFCFFLLSEADMIWAFNDFSGLTIDVSKYLAVVLSCQNALSLGIIYHFQVILDSYRRSFPSSLVTVIPFWSSSDRVLWALQFQAKAQDGWSVLQTWVFKRFLPAGKWVLFTRSLSSSGEKMYSRGFLH